MSFVLLHLVSGFVFLKLCFCPWLDSSPERPKLKLNFRSFATEQNRKMGIVSSTLEYGQSFLYSRSSSDLADLDFSALPTDIIFACMDQMDADFILSKWSLVSKKWLEIVKREDLWKSLAQRDFPPSLKPNENQTWRSFYLEGPDSIFRSEHLDHPIIPKKNLHLFKHPPPNFKRSDHPGKKKTKRKK